MRSVDQLLEELHRFLPAHYDTADALLAGLAAPMQKAEAVADALVPLATLSESSGRWLDLTGRSLGVLRAPGESDADYQRRLRVIPDALTRPAIKAAVDDILLTGVSVIREWFEEGYLDVLDNTGMWLNTTLLSGGPHSFLVIIDPQAPGGFAWGDFIDVDFFLDSSFVGVLEHPIYSAIVNQVERLRAAGVFWRLVLNT